MLPVVCPDDLGARCGGDVLGQAYTLFHVGGFKYWSMDPTPETTELINRKIVIEAPAD
jgi:hypothetical protein